MFWQILTLFICFCSCFCSWYLLWHERHGKICWWVELYLYLEWLSIFYSLILIFIAFIKFCLKGSGYWLSFGYSVCAIWCFLYWFEKNWNVFYRYKIVDFFNYYKFFCCEWWAAAIFFRFLICLLQFLACRFSSIPFTSFSRLTKLTLIHFVRLQTIILCRMSSNPNAFIRIHGVGLQQNDLYSSFRHPMCTSLLHFFCRLHTILHIFIFRIAKHHDQILVHFCSKNRPLNLMACHSSSTLHICVTIWLPVSIIEVLVAFTVLISILYFTVILWEGWPDEALSFRFVVFPRTRVELIARLPFSLTVFHAVYKDSMIDVSVGPKKESVNIFGFVVDKSTDVDVSCCVL